MMQVTDPLAIKELMRNKFIARLKQDFFGASFVLDPTIVHNIANCVESDESD